MKYWKLVYTNGYSGSISLKIDLTQPEHETMPFLNEITGNYVEITRAEYISLAKETIFKNDMSALDDIITSVQETIKDYAILEQGSTITKQDVKKIISLELLLASNLVKTALKETLTPVPFELYEAFVKVLKIFNADIDVANKTDYQELMDVIELMCQGTPLESVLTQIEVNMARP